MPTKTAGARLRKERRAHALTQRELAEKAGLTHASIVRLEKGQHEPRMTTVRKLAEALGVEPRRLIAH